MTFRLLLVCILFSGSSFAQNSIGQFPSIAFVNKVHLADSVNSTINKGCGFLFENDGEIYAATSKHVLFDSTRTNVQLVFKSWVMSVENDTTEKVICNNIINQSQLQPKIDSINNQNNDWLLFNVSDNKSSNKILELRTTELVSGEPLYALGWSEHHRNELQQTYIYTYIGTQGNFVQMRRIIAPGGDEMLWGAPIVDKEGLLVGIMAPRIYDNTLNEIYSRACSANLVLDFFKIKGN